MRSSVASGRPPTKKEHATCRLCGGESSHWLEVPGDWRRPKARRTYRVRRCAACDLGFLDPMPSPEEVRSFYDVGPFTRSTTAYPRLVGGHHIVDRALMAIARRLDHATEVDATWMRRRFGRDRLRVCDLGCGNGGLLQRIAPLGHTLAGLEIAPLAASIARGIGLDVLDGAIEEMPPALSSQRFDVVFCMHVLEHCVDPDLALARAASLLSSSGTLVVEVPNNASRGLAIAGAAWSFLDVPRHLHFYTKRSLTRAVERAGLEVADVEYVGYHRQFSTAWIEQEQTIWDRLLEHAGSADALPRRSSRRRARSLLVSTLLGRPERTHDSVRLLCRAPSSRAIGARSLGRDRSARSEHPQR